jgi:glycerol uptake facilitator-like aquaporin
MVMVFAGGHISGGHYNPAVSTAAVMRGKLPAGDYGAYIVTQAVAAIIAGLLVGAMGYAPARAMALAGSGTMLVAEFPFTFALAFVVLNVATAQDTETTPTSGWRSASRLPRGTSRSAPSPAARSTPRSRSVLPHSVCSPGATSGSI